MNKTTKKHNKTPDAKLGGMALMPPQFNAVSVIRRTFRFRATSLLNGFPATTANLIGILRVGTTASQVADLTAAFRIKRIRIWAPPPVAASLANTVSLEWGPAGVGTVPGRGMRNSIISDTVLGSTTPIRLNCKPPSGSWAADWVNLGDTNVVFTINGNSGASLGAPVGTIVDITGEWQIQSGEAPVLTACTTAVVGTVYVTPDLANGTLVPVSAPTYVR
jgi:hypothetical protein